MRVREREGQEWAVTEGGSRPDQRAELGVPLRGPHSRSCHLSIQTQVTPETLSYLLHKAPVEAGVSRSWGAQGGLQCERAAGDHTEVPRGPGLSPHRPALAAVFPLSARGRLRTSSQGHVILVTVLLARLVGHFLR